MTRTQMEASSTEFRTLGILWAASCYSWPVKAYQVKLPSTPIDWMKIKEHGMLIKGLYEYHLRIQDK